MVTKKITTLARQILRHEFCRSLSLCCWSGRNTPLVMADLGSSCPPHGLVLSFPMQGHINPILHFCSKLADSYGVAVTFVLSELEYARMKHKDPKKTGHLKGDASPTSYRNTGMIKFAGISDNLPMDLSVKQTGGAEFRDSYDALQNMRDGVEKLLVRIQASPAPVSFILADTFVDWAHEVALLFKLPLFAFFASNAASALIFLHAPSLLEKGILPFRDEYDNFIANDPVKDIPGLKSVHPRDFPICFTFGPSHYRYQFVLRHHRNFHHCRAMVANTFEELEDTAVLALRKDVNVLPIGPLLLSCALDDKKILKLSYWPEDSECLKWLDAQNPASVVYISFGSIATLSAHQMKQLALGLEASGQPFVWVIRADSIEGDLFNNLPEGYMSRIKNQGLIISWAPQVGVLSHRAVGGFLTHCGWNSMMENLSVGGLPVICWPFVAEQRMNCRIFVDEWQIGVEVMRNKEGVVEGKEIEKAVRELMVGERGKVMRAGMKKLQDDARKAAINGGSSAANLASFVKALKVY